MQAPPILTSDASTRAVAGCIEEALKQRRVRRQHDGEMLRRLSARHVAARYILQEVLAIGMAADPADPDGRCARAAASCDELLEKLRDASGEAAAQIGVAEAARRAAAEGCGAATYDACRARAVEYVRPRLAKRADDTAEECAQCVGGTGQLPAEALRLVSTRDAARQRLRREEETITRLRADINRALEEAVRKACGVLDQRITAEAFDTTHAQHLLALLEALQAKVHVLTADAEVATYTPETLAALRRLRSVLQEASGSARLEEQTLCALLQQYRDAEEADQDFSRINEECRLLEKEKAALLQQRQQ